MNQSIWVNCQTIMSDLLRKKSQYLEEEKWERKTKARNDTLKATCDMAPRFNLDLVSFIYSSLRGAWESWLVHLSLVYETSSFFITVTIWRHDVLLSCICIKGSISTIEVQKASNDFINSEWLSLFLKWRKTKTIGLSQLWRCLPQIYRTILGSSCSLFEWKEKCSKCSLPRQI